MAMMEQQAREDGRRIPDPPPFEDRAEDDILSDKGKPWASKTLANRRLRDLPNGYRLARTAKGWVIKPEDIANPGATIGQGPAEGPGSDAGNGFKQGPKAGERYRVGVVAFVGGAVSLEKRLPAGTAATFYIGKDGNLIDGDFVNLIGDGKDRLWIPATPEQAQQAQAILDEMGRLELNDPARKDAKARLKALVQGKPTQEPNEAARPQAQAAAGESAAPAAAPAPQPEDIANPTETPAGGRPARVVAVAPGTGGKLKITLDNGVSASTDEFAPTLTTERYTPEKSDPAAAPTPAEPTVHPAGSTVTLDGKRYTVAKTGKASVTLEGEDGKKRTVQVSGATYGKIQAVSEPAAVSPAQTAEPASTAQTESRNPPPQPRPEEAGGAAPSSPVAGGATLPVATGNRPSEGAGQRADSSANGSTKPSTNTIVSDDAAERARALLRKKLGNINSGLDPEVLQAGITLAAYHVERGARKFSAYAKAMVDDLGDIVKPYLQSWYMAVRSDPRAVDMKASMDKASAVEDLTAADIDAMVAPQTEAKPATPLYASRAVTNAKAIIDWARSQGFKSTLKPEDLHVTIAYSRDAVDGAALPKDAASLTASGGKRSVEPLGEEGAVVLKFNSPELQARWKAYRAAGASWDYDAYTPHVTITYDGKGVDLAKVQPYTGPIELGAEQQEPLNVNKKDDYKESSAPPPAEEATPSVPEPEPAPATVPAPEPAPEPAPPLPPARRAPKSFRKTVQVTTQAYIEESKKFEPREMDAETALSAIYEDIKQLKAFRACITKA